MILKKLLTEEKGSALVVLCLMLVFILGCTALVTDVGLMYANQIKVTNAADAAALAGVQALPDDQIKAEALAREYAAKNQVTDVMVNIYDNKKEIKVKTQRTIDLFFARVLGYQTSTATAQAKAILEPLTGVKGVVPLGVEEQTFIFGEKYVLKYAAGDDPEGEYHPGWMGILALQGPGANLYLEDLKYGFDQEIKIGDVINVQTGNISGNTYDGIQYRIDQCKHTPSCTADCYVEDCPKIMYVPVIRAYADKQVQVVGLTAFLVESVAGMGNENYIIGEFIQHTTSGSSSPTGPDNGVYVPRLSR